MPISTVAADVLNREFLSIRSRLIDVAAAMDRIERAEGVVTDDPRLQKILRSLEVLAGPSSQRTEQIQMIFSLPWEEGLGTRG